MDTKLRLLGDLQINEVISRYPAAVRVFHRYGMDTCCGGGLPVREAAARHGHDPEEVIEALGRMMSSEE